MKKINCYKGDFFGFHQKVVKSKKKRGEDQDYKTRLEGLDDNIRMLYTDYTTKFDKNELDLIVPHGYSSQSKTDLESLYSYKSAPIQDLVISLTTSPDNRVDKLCRCCTINSVGTMDHYLPQSVFPEFIVNPQNLFPMCSECNTYKGNAVIISGQRNFLNLYIDELPSCQYLFVTFDEKLAPIFSIENRNGITPDLFAVIQNHYNKLHLCTRYSAASYQIYSKLKSTIKNYIKSTPIEVIKQSTIDTANDMKDIYGFNFWKSILEIELIQNENFINECSI